MNKCYYDLLYPLGIVLVLIIVYILLLNTLILPSMDPLLRQVDIRYLGGFLNGWTITHFLAFMVIGYYYPDCFKEAMSYGILWELFEFSFGEFFPQLFPGLAHQIDPTWSLYYYGRYEDIVMNFLGFIVGKYLRQWREDT